MSRRLPGVRVSACLVAALLVGLAACGADDSGSAGDAERSTPSPAASPSPSPSASASPSGRPETVKQALAARMHAQDGLLGRARGVIRVTGPRGPAETDADKAYQAEARKNGVVAGANQHLVVPGTDDAIRTVVLFKRPSGAAAQARFQPSPGRRFTIPGVPGAIGIEYLQNGSVVGANLYFTSGPYEYILGIAPKGPRAAGRAELVAAGRAWYQKVSSLD